MSAAILKYPLEAPEVELLVPGVAEALHVAPQRGRLCLWAKVTQGAPGKLLVTTRGTGEELGSAELGKFVGTVLLNNGALVLHVFARFVAQETLALDGEVVS